MRVCSIFTCVRLLIGFCHGARGGALGLPYLSSWRCDVTDSIFDGCFAENLDYGGGCSGAIDAEWSSGSYITNSIFLNCTGVNSGREEAHSGALNGGPSCNVTNSSFRNCSAVVRNGQGSWTAFAGAICGELCVITSSSFVNCSAINRRANTAYGGAIRVTSTISIANSSFLNCSAISAGSTAAYGGAIHVASTCSITDSSFSTCSGIASGSGDALGGAIYASASCSIVRYRFMGRVAKSGNYAEATISVTVNDFARAVTGNHIGAMLDQFHVLWKRRLHSLRVPSS